MSRQALKNDYSPLIFAALCAISLFAARRAESYETKTAETTGVPCAILENFGGDVEVLDPSRTRVVGLTKNTSIPCGGWVTSGNGWAIIHHRDGHDLRIGPNTFLEIPESQPGSTDPAFADQVVLYRGEMFGSTFGGGGELRVVTANARARIKAGTFLLNFTPDEQDTQLVALDRPASLENRFAPEKKVVVKAGESTDLNFKELRVVPTYPKAVSVASLHDKLGLFRVNEEDQSKYYETAQARAERRLAADLDSQSDADKAAPQHPDENPANDGPGQVTDRKIASTADGYVPHSAYAPAVATVKKKHYTYDRSAVDSEQNQRLKAQWAKKMTAGEDVGERILYPDKFYGKPQKVKITISDPGAQMDAQKKRSDDAEKRRLMKELSQIQE